jgi:hypothetical protein
MDKNFIEKYVDLIRKALDSVACKIDGPGFLQKLEKKLGFEEEHSWAFLTSSLDLIEDTEKAKENFYKYHLAGPTKYDDVGEKYLRLYGILNAVFLQRNAVFKLGEIFRTINESKKASILNLRIIKLRNIVASHATDYHDKESGKHKTFMLARISLEAEELMCLDEKNKTTRYNLSRLVEEFNVKILELIDEIAEEALKVSKTKARYLLEIKRLRNERNGYIYVGKMVVKSRIPRPKINEYF